MATSTIDSDLYINGALSAKTATLPASCVTNAAVAASAGIVATKLQQQYQKAYCQESAATSASEARVVHIVYGATGTVISLKAGVVVACAGGATVTVDLLKNGASILSAVISIDNTKAAYALTTAAGYSSAALVQGDVLEIKIVATAGGGTIGKGVFAELILREDPQ